jgi:hypothetical protein
MSAHQLVTWLYASPLSTMIRDEFWIVPTVQSLHIVAIAVIFGSAVISDLRLAGVFATDEPSGSVVRRYFPWMRNALVVLLLTGLVMSIGEPDRVLVNTTFWIKMGLVAGVFTVSWLVRRPLLAPQANPRQVRGAGFIKPVAWLSIVLWCLVIFCGRWIAYSI